MPPLRPLLPAVRPLRPPPEVDHPKSRKAVSACESCRSHKSKCDGLPTCSACIRRNSPCRYNPTETRQIRKKHERLQQRQSVYEELIELLRTIDEQDAAKIFLRLKAGADVESIVKHVRDGNLLLQLSVAPETTRRYEFPLISEMPSHLFVAGNPYLESLLCMSIFLPSTSPCEASNEGNNVKKNGLTRQENYRIESSRHRAAPANTRHSAYELPYHTARLVEPLVDSVTATPWTKVISDDRLFRRLICSYFHYPHPCGPFVHKDLFLKDMAAGRTSFCSPLLVNAMLANACQSCPDIPNQSKIWLPESLTYRFMAEARRLWDLESLPGKSNITTIQAALIMSYHTTNNGLDEIGASYSKRACKMSEDLELFGTNDHGTGTDMAKARLFTAWAIFSWQAMFDFAFFRQPYFSQPPQVPLPDPQQDESWYGEIWLQYPRDQTIVPSYLGLKLRSEAALHAIMNDIGLLLFKRPSPQTLNVDDIIVLKGKLDHWKDTLPKPLQPEMLFLPSHLMLHIQYWQVVQSVMQLIVNVSCPNETRALDLDAGENALSVLHTTRIMLETVTCLYYARHSWKFYDPWIAFALTLIGNAVIHDLKTKPDIDPDTLNGYRSVLVLSAQGLATQGLKYHNGILLAAQLQASMRPQDLQLICTYGKAAFISESDKRMLAEHSHSQWPLPGMIAINEDPEKARLKGLIETSEDVLIQPCGL